MLNAGAFPENEAVFYLAPDTLEWEDLSLGHSQRA